MMVNQTRNSLFYLKARGNQTTERNNSYIRQVNSTLFAGQNNTGYLNMNKDPFSEALLTRIK